jgi:hypothetical protein
MEIKDIICTCTLAQRGQAFNAFVNDNVNKHLDSFKYKISHLSESEKRELLAKEIKTYEFVFSSDYAVSEPLKYSLFYLPNALQFASVWRDFKKGYENRFGDEFKDFHLDACPIIQPSINENGASITPEPIRHRFNLAWFPYAYFFYLRLKEYYGTKYEDKPSINEMGAKGNQFEDYFIKGDRKEIIKTLKSLYSNSKPKSIVLMLKALAKLEYINDVGSNTNKSGLHKVLEETFGKIGTPQGLTKQLNSFSIPNNFNESQIDLEVKKIVSNLSET